MVGPDARQASGSRSDKRERHVFSCREKSPIQSRISTLPMTPRTEQREPCALIALFASRFTKTAFVRGYSSVLPNPKAVRAVVVVDGATQ